MDFGFRIEFAFKSLHLAFDYLDEINFFRASASRAPKIDSTEIMIERVLLDSFNVKEILPKRTLIFSSRDRIEIFNNGIADAVIRELTSSPC